MLKGASLKDILDLATKGAACFVTAVYAIGFIATNAHLSQFGYFDYQLSNLRFFVVGGLCIAYFGCWYLFAGRYIVNVKRILTNYVKRVTEVGGSPLWAVPLFIDSLIFESLLMIAMSCVFFATTVMRVSAVELFLAPLLLNFLVVYPLDVADVDLKRPRLFFIVQFVMKLPTLVGFVALLYLDPNVLKLFVSFFSMSIFLNMMLDTYERRPATRDLAIFTGLFSALVILSSIVWFGYSIYGGIAQKVGGGEPISAVVHMRPRPDIRQTAQMSGQIVYRNGSDTLFEAGGKTIVINNQDIADIQYVKPDRTALIANLASSLEELHAIVRRWAP